MAPSDKAILPAGSGGIAAADRIPSVESVMQPSATTMLARRVLGHRSFVVAAFIMVGLILAAVFAPLLAPHDPLDQDLTRRLIPPIWSERGTWEHVLGTDMMGRDYLSRLIYGARYSLLISVSSVIIGGTLGFVVGLVSGVLMRRESGHV